MAARAELYPGSGVRNLHQPSSTSVSRVPERSGNCAGVDGGVFHFAQWKGKCDYTKKAMFGEMGFARQSQRQQKIINPSSYCFAAGSQCRAYGRADPATLC